MLEMTNEKFAEFARGIREPSNDEPAINIADEFTQALLTELKKLVGDKWETTTGQVSI
jgi:hypothetical protein